MGRGRFCSRCPTPQKPQLVWQWGVGSLGHLCGLKESYTTYYLNERPVYLCASCLWQYHDVYVKIVFVVCQVQEKYVEYTNCETSNGERCDKFLENVTNTGKTCVCTVKFSLSQAFKGDVFMYYGLSNFYQVCKEQFSQYTVYKLCTIFQHRPR